MEESFWETMIKDKVSREAKSSMMNKPSLKDKLKRYVENIVLIVLKGLFLLLMALPIPLIFGLLIMEKTPQERQTERILRSEGSVIDKEVDPSGYRYNFWLGRTEYMPDRYYLKVRLGDGSVIKKKVDAVKYMQTNIGDEVKND